MFAKYKFITLIVFILILTLVSIFGYKQYCNFIFNAAMEKAAKVSSETWDKKYQDNKIRNDYRVVFITNNGGEFSYAEYFKYAAEKMGWKVQIYYNQMLGNEPKILKFNPDFIIFSQFAETIPDLNTKINSHRSKKYLLSFSSIDALRNRFKWIKS